MKASKCVSQRPSCAMTVKCIYGMRFKPESKPDFGSLLFPCAYCSSSQTLSKRPAGFLAPQFFFFLGIKTDRSVPSKFALKRQVTSAAAPIQPPNKTSMQKLDNFESEPFFSLSLYLYLSLSHSLYPHPPNPIIGPLHPPLKKELELPEFETLDPVRFPRKLPSSPVASAEQSRAEQSRACRVLTSEVAAVSNQKETGGPGRGCLAGRWGVDEGVKGTGWGGWFEIAFG